MAGRTAMVAELMKTMGLPTSIVGRPNSVRFGPFAFQRRGVTLAGGGIDFQLNSATGTIDKKLNSLNSDQKYWLIFGGFKQFWGSTVQEAPRVLQDLGNNPWLAMERNDQFTYEQTAWASNMAAVPTGTTVAATTTFTPQVNNDPYIFKHWWVLDGESDKLSIGTDVGVTPTGILDATTWMYGVAIAKSAMESFPEPECGPQALRQLAAEGVKPLSSVFSLLGRA